MKRPRMTARPSVLLLLALLLVIPQPVNARMDNPKPSPISVGLMTPDIPGTVCTGGKLKLEFYFTYLYNPEPSPVPVPAPLVRNATVDISGKVGKVSPKRFVYPWVKFNSANTGTFTYKAGKKEGQETINIKVTTMGEEATLSISFAVKKCSASLQFNQSTTLSYGPVSVVNNYFGSGSLSTDDNGQVSGGGVQAIWGDIPPYSIDGGTCTHTPPWEGSSSITFTGQVGDEENDSNMMMEMEPLHINASTLTCSGEGSGSMPFPAYTYSSCEVPLIGFNFAPITLAVPIDCPGEAPYNLPITIIPRR